MQYHTYYTLNSSEELLRKHLLRSAVSFGVLGLLGTLLRLLRLLNFRPRRLRLGLGLFLGDCLRLGGCLRLGDCLRLANGTTA